MITIKAIDSTGYSKSTQWCVPSAIAMLTGLPLREATQLLSRIRQEPYHELKGTWTEEAVIALNELGYRSTPLDIAGRFSDTTHGPTLRRFMNNRLPQEISNPLLIMVEGHALVSHWGLLGDNSTGGHMVPVARFPKPNRLVKEAFIITKGN